MRALSLTIVCLVASFSAIPAMAVPDSFFDVYTDWFSAELGGGLNQETEKIDWNVLLYGDGSGYRTTPEPQQAGPWFPYGLPLTGESIGQIDPWGNENPVPGWHNQWFYDGNYRPGYKVVDISFAYSLMDPTKNGGANIVINWTTPEWSLDPAKPAGPPMLNEDPLTGVPWIGRALVGEAWLEPEEGNPVGNNIFTGHYDLSQYGVPFNPEWVSIDIVGYNVLLSPPGGVASNFTHTCVPEPGTLVLLLTAGIGLLLFAWRRRK
jgi:hypothetical protein